MGDLTLQTINDGDRNLVVKAHFVADSQTDETGLTIINASEYSPPFIQSRLKCLTILSFGAFGGALIWEADANVRLCALPPNGNVELDWSRFGGLPNNAGVGKTGDILLLTDSIASGDELTLVFELQKDIKK